MMAKRRLIFLTLAGLLLLIACGPAALALAFGRSPGSERAPAATPSPSATARPALIPDSSLTPDRRSTPTAPAVPTLAACQVSAWRLFLRADPRRASRGLAVLSGGDLLTILPTPTPAGGRWLPVQAGELAGWVSSDFCEAIR